MNTIESLKSHIKRISKYNDITLYKEIDSFIELNKNLSEEELLKKLYATYENRIKFLEASTHAKTIISIKEWVATLGIFFLIGLIASLFLFLASMVK